MQEIREKIGNICLDVWHPVWRKGSEMQLNETMTKFYPFRLNHFRLNDVIEWEIKAAKLTLLKEIKS